MDELEISVNTDGSVELFNGFKSVLIPEDEVQEWAPGAVGPYIDGISDEGQPEVTYDFTENDVDGLKECLREHGE